MRNLPLLIIMSLGFCAQTALAQVAVSVLPETVQQGEPMMITIDGIDKSRIQSLKFNSKTVPVFIYKSKPAAFLGIDLNMKPGAYDLNLSLTTGENINKKIQISARKIVEAPLGIPEKLGGDTPASQANLVSSLSLENSILAGLYTNPKTLWTDKFIFPLGKITVTDPYGYLRETGAYTIAHKGTDFRAVEGTSVYAVNRGVVRLVRTFPTYGKTIVIDHGQGVMSFYMHLSKVNVKEGTLATRGQIIGQSGQTGYAASPHLHLTIRLNGTSIDPMKFMEFFK